MEEKKTLTEQEIAIQYEGTTPDGENPDESLMGVAPETITEPDQNISQEEYEERRKLKNDSVFL